jgi:hypothetical protein
MSERIGRSSGDGEPDTRPLTGHNIFTDSRYATFESMEAQLALGNTWTATWDKRRMHSPVKELAEIEKDLAWGEWTSLHRGDYEILAIGDANVFFLISNGFSAKTKGSLVRKNPDTDQWTRWEGPYTWQAYTQRMHGVDDHTQSQNKVSVVKHCKVLRFPSKKSQMFDEILLTNSFKCYNQIHTNATKTAYVLEWIHAEMDTIQLRTRNWMPSFLPDLRDCLPLCAHRVRAYGPLDATARKRVRAQPSSDPAPGPTPGGENVDESDGEDSNNAVITKAGGHTWVKNSTKELKGGRDCGVCKAGLGPFGNGQVGFRRQTLGMCDTCIKPKFMHKECFGFHPAHVKPN